MKKLDARVLGIKAECLNHLCQDAIAIHQFTDINGQKVYTGAISDGCSGEFGSEHGSAFLVKTFIEEVENLGKTGNRDNDFLHKVTLSILERMAAYQPQNTNSEIIRCHSVNISKELVATLYGFVADENKILLLLAGDGVIMINGHSKIIEQKGGDLYPYCLLLFPKKEWPKRISEIFFFTEIPTDRINNLVLATDGFSHPDPATYPDITRDPVAFVMQAEFHATKPDSADGIPGSQASRGGDDATAIIFCPANAPSKDSFDLNEVSNLCHCVSNPETKALQSALKKTREEIIRPCLLSEDEITDSPIFRRTIASSEGVFLYGVTADDLVKYERQRDSILRSRVSHNNDSSPFGFSGGQAGVKMRSRKSILTNNADIKPKKNFMKTRIALKEVIPVRVTTSKPVPAVKTAPPIVKKSAVCAKPSTDERPKIATLKPVQKKQGVKSIPFLDLCDRRMSLRHGIGFRHFGQVMFDLWHFVQECHEAGMRLGNLRPQDLNIEIIRAKKAGGSLPKPAKYHFSLVKPDNVARIVSSGDLIKDYDDLDHNFVHPDYLPQLGTDDAARLNQDWYAFSVLCCWLVTKHDPFGEGKVIRQPNADRIYRMKHTLLNDSLEIDIDEHKRLFIDRATARLSSQVQDFVQSFRLRMNLHQSPYFLLEEFRQGNILTCQAEIFKRRRYNSPRKVQCGFKQMYGINTCGYCRKQMLQMITSSHQMFQSAIEAATD